MLVTRTEPETTHLALTLKPGDKVDCGLGTVEIKWLDGGKVGVVFHYPPHVKIVRHAAKNKEPRNGQSN